MNAERRPASGQSEGAAPSTDEAGEASRPNATEEPGRDSAPATEPAARDGASPAAPDGDGDAPAAAGVAGTATAGDETGDPANGGSEPETGAGTQAQEVVAETVESLLEQLEEARGALADEREAALRARAEVENVRRRAARDVEQAHRFGIEGLVGELMPVRDGLELGIRAAKEEGSTVDSLAEGTEMTLRMLTNVLEKFGAVEVNPEGEDFDPTYHQAMSMREAEGVESGKVLQVFQKGFVLNGRVVRPAMVIVSK